MGKSYLCSTFLIVAVVIAAVSSFSIDSPQEEPELESRRVRFYGYQVFRVRAETEEQFKDLISLHTGDPQLDFWRVGHELGDFSDVMVAPEKNAFFQEYLTSHQIPYEIHIADVERLVGEERRMNDEARKGKTSSRIGWEAYYSLNEIYAWMEELAQKYPSSVQVSTIGTTFEGQPIKYLKLATDPTTAKKTIFMDGGIHAREWIAPAVTTYIMNELITNEGGKYSDILDKCDFYFIPVLNPDGYYYSFTTDRMWRKNRRVNSGSNCRGVDLNRNFDYQWAAVGSSTNPCSEIYHGSKGCSEAESIALQTLLHGIQTAGTALCYLTFHSYGQFMLTPWGFKSEYPEDYDSHLYPAAKAACDAIWSHEGKKYTIGTSTNVLYSAAGGSDDYAKGACDFKYSYCIELRDEGQYGFNLPPGQIKATCIETMLGVAVLCREMISKMAL